MRAKPIKMTNRFARFVRVAQTRTAETAHIGHRHIYIMPTRYGFLYGILVLLLLLGSINDANNLGLMLTFLLTGLGLVTMLQTYRNQLGLHLHAVRADPVFAGEHACFEIRVHNPGNRLRRTIQLRTPQGDPLASDIPENEAATLSLCIPTRRRGVTRLGRFSIATEYPLGLLRAWSYVELQARCVVYPAPAPPTELPTAPEFTSNQEGDRGVGADDFVGLRPYRTNDPPPHIDWKSLARERGLMTKQFGGDRAETLWLDWKALPGGDSESRLSLLCRWVLTASERQQVYGLRLPGLEIPPDRDAAHRHRCLVALARFDGQ